jgi:hypothetical protein
MKLIISALFLIIFNLSIDESEVYICVSKTASKYQLDDSCKGLSRCTHTVKKVTKSEAKKMGYTICGWED